VTTRLGSGVGSAATSAVARFTTDAATVEVGAGGTETTRGVSGPRETGLFAIGGEHGVLALGARSELGDWPA
jgi:hypothetical protein